MSRITESVVEDAAISWMEALGYTYLHGSVIAPGEDGEERSNYQQVLLRDRVRSALARINPQLTSDTIDQVFRTVTTPPSPSLNENNQAFHRALINGIPVENKLPDGSTRGDLAWVIDFDNPDNNDWLVVNQFTVIEGKHNRRPDMVVFINGLPISVIELKNPEDENATALSAWKQLQTYKSQISSLFNTNELLVISDGVDARLGSLTAGYERFGPWRTVDGLEVAPDAVPKLQVLLEGVFEKRRLLDYLRHFIFWETDDGYIKKIAGYHQFHAVNKAVSATVAASSTDGDQRIGVVWHTQGSGKSVSMAFYAGKIMLRPEMANPTLVVITDRNDLDQQLHGQFAAAKDVLREAPEQADSRDDLRDLLNRASGGIIFTTLQKFGTAVGERMPELSDRRNIVVIADEAHRSHYAFVQGFARNLHDALPNASYIGFTGTPIEFDDASTPEVFGDYIDQYTISQAVDDGATVPIYYEARIAKIKLPEEKLPILDEEFEEVTEAEEESDKSKLKSTWSKLEALVGSEERLGLIADDILDHWGRRTEILAGKGMIVCMSRRICVDLYEAIARRRPDWHSEDDDAGRIKVVMTGAATDPANFQQHIRNKANQKEIEKRFKDPDDPLELVIVRDMWLTGFNVPSAHSLYLDKPMKGHTLMQAIARVNRVFLDKPSGLVVDYLGLADQLRKAVDRYGGKGRDRPSIPIEQALRVLEEKCEIVRTMYHGFDYTGFFTTQATARLSTLVAGSDHVLALDDGKKRYLDAMAALNKAAGIAIHLEGARVLRDDIGFFQAVEKSIRKVSGPDPKEQEQLNAAIRQIVSAAISSEGVIDVFAAAGLKKPDISILSNDFLETVKASPHKNLQMELLRKLLNDEIRALSRQNVVQSKKFSEMLERTMLAYQNRSLEAVQVILELIEMAKELRDAPKRGEQLGLSEDELAFYDALAAHGDVKEVMGDDLLAAIAHELVETVRNSVTIDWTQKESVRAKMRTRIKRLLRKYGYPPDKRAEAVETVILQAEVVSREWAA
jgi:type I restriction enzyme, R subunit